MIEILYLIPNVSWNTIHCSPPIKRSGGDSSRLWSRAFACIGAIHRARKITKGSIRDELWYRNRIPCIRICLYNRCIGQEVLREGKPDKQSKIIEVSGAGPYMRSLSKTSAPYKIRPERMRKYKQFLIVSV